MDAIKQALKNKLDESKTPGGLTLDIIIGKDGKVSGDSSHGESAKDEAAEHDDESSDMAPEVMAKPDPGKPGMEDPAMSMKNNLENEQGLNEQIVKSFADSSSPGRGAMGLHERAAALAKEKMKSFGKGK